MEKEKKIITGFDIGGAHLKVARTENGRVVNATTIAAPLWQGVDKLTSALAEALPLYADADLKAFTMTGELADVFTSREAGVATLLNEIEQRISGEAKLIYAGRSGFVTMAQASSLGADVASANWNATAAIVAKLAGGGLFVDMGSTTTDLIAIRDGAVANRGYSDAERLLTGELVYTGFTRSYLFSVASSAPVRGRLTPLMNEYFASMADVHRIMGALDERDDKHPAADGKEKTVPASCARLARIVGRDAPDMDLTGWLNLARWFSQHQHRMVHDAAFRVASNVAGQAPVIGAGIGRWQIRRLAQRMERDFVDFSDIITADDAVRNDASNAAPAVAVALLAGARE